MWQACATQEEIAEAVGVDQKTIGNWEEEFVKSPEDGLLTNPPGFEPPIYNVWTVNLGVNPHHKPVQRCTGITTVSPVLL
jgi:hypothetical protein